MDSHLRAHNLGVERGDPSTSKYVISVWQIKKVAYSAKIGSACLGEGLCLVYWDVAQSVHFLSNQ